MVNPFETNIDNSSANTTAIPFTQSQEKADVDSGLRSYMNQVYGLMSLGLLITSIVSFVASHNMQLMQSIWTTNLKWVVVLSPLAIAFFLRPAINRLSIQGAIGVFVLFATAMGLSLSSIFLIYTSASIFSTFLISAIMFGSASLYGYVTKRDLTTMGHYLGMALFGVIIAMVINMFLHSSGLQYIISFIAIILFTGLTAYDTQQIKDAYYLASDQSSVKKLALMGAITLYIDMVNLFIYLLQFLGERR